MVDVVEVGLVESTSMRGRVEVEAEAAGADGAHPAARARAHAQAMRAWVNRLIIGLSYHAPSPESRHRIIYLCIQRGI